MNFLKFRTDVSYYFNNFKIIIDKTMLLCYNMFVVKGEGNEKLNKNEKIKKWRRKIWK